MARPARLALLSLIAALACSASANAAVVRTQLTPDGFAGAIAAASTTTNGLDLDTASDGSAIAAWIQQDTGVNHLFAARLIGGTWTSAARIDTGLTNPASDPAVAIAPGGEAVVMFASGPNPASASPYSITVASNASAFGPPGLRATGAGWGLFDVDLAPNGKGYAVASISGQLHAFRIDNGLFSSVGGSYPVGVLNNNAGGVAADTEAKRARVSVDPIGAKGVVTWSESMSATQLPYAALLSGTIPDPAVSGSVPVFDSQVVVPSNGDQLAIAQSGAAAWIVQRAAYSYPGGNKTRLLARTFDGTTWGAPVAVDAAEAATLGSSNPAIALDAAGNGLVTSDLGTGQAAIARMKAGAWQAGQATPSVTSQHAAAITPAGVGLAVFTDLNDPTGQIILGRRVGGTLSAATDELSGSFGQRKAAASAGGIPNAGLVVWRQGTGAAARIWAATIDLPAGAEPSGTGGGPTTTAPKLTGLRISKTSVKASKKKPQILSGTPKGTYLEFTLDTAATVTLTLKAELPGRLPKSGATCVKQTPANKTKRRCKRYVDQKGQQFTLSLPAGTTRINFSGRLGGKKPVAKGTYRLVAVASGATGTSTPQHVSVRVK